MPTDAGKGQRVPERQRRRAAVSCDFCKHRRAKCIRGLPQEPCTNCVANRIKCESTLPRKQRVYGSIESLSIRYRALDALVRGLFQDENINDLDTLYRIGEEKHISMPQRDDLASAPELFAAATSRRVSVATSTAHSTRPESARSIEINELRRRDTTEKLIPTSQGVGHYVGPSSSFRFVTAIRSLVAQCHNVSNFSQKALRADFVDLRTSKALEIQDPPGPEGASQADLVGPTHTSPSASAHTPLDVGVQSEFSNEGTQSQGFLLPRDMADSFVRIFFDQVHPNYPVFHLGTFQLQYESLWQPSGNIGASANLHPIKTDTGYMCCLAMVFTFGAQATSQHHNSAQSITIQRRYLEFVRSSLGRLTGTTSVINVQALLLLQLYEHNSGQRNASWMFLGSAARMAVALGMHRETAESADFDPVERDTRRRVWATLYAFERNLCVILGRPSAIDDAEVTISMPTESMTEAPRGFAEQQMRLIKLTWHIKQTIYNTYHNDGIIPSLAVSRALLSDLDDWYVSLPAHLLPDWRSMIEHHRRAVLLLHTQYHHAMTLVLRPYLLYQAETELGLTSHKHEKDRFQEDELGSLRHTCVISTEKSLEYLTKLANDGLLNGVSWVDVYYLYHCTLVLCLELLSCTTSSESHKEATITDQSRLARLKEAVRSCLKIAQQTQLSPTYRVLMMVARQFAGVVGVSDYTPGEPMNSGERVDFGEEIMTTLAAETATPGNIHLQQPWIQEWLMPGVTGSQCDSFDMGAYATPFSLALSDAQYMEPVDMLPMDLFRT